MHTIVYIYLDCWFGRWTPPLQTHFDGKSFFIALHLLCRGLFLLPSLLAVLLHIHLILFFNRTTVQRLEWMKSHSIFEEMGSIDAFQIELTGHLVLSINYLEAHVPPANRWSNYLMFYSINYRASYSSKLFWAYLLQLMIKAMKNV